MSEQGLRGKGSVARGPKFVGLVTLAVVMLVVGALFVPSGLALGRSTYYAELKQAGGLKPGDEVRVAGVGVGRVKSLEIRDARVRVAFRISGDVELGRDSQAAVKIATLLGNHYLDLRPRGGGPLPGDTIPLANTTVPFEVQDIIEAGGPALEELDGVKLQAALGVLSDDFRNTPELTTQALDGLARLSRVIVTRKDQLDRLIRSADAVTANLNSNRAQLLDLMRQASLIFTEVTRRREAIGELLTDTTALARQLTALVRENQAKVTPLLDHLEVVLGTLRANEKSLERTATLLGPTARYFANATGDGPYIGVVAPNAILPDSLLCRVQAKC